MKFSIRGICIALISAALGSILVSLCIGGISLCPSVFIVAAPVCLFSGLVVLQPWTCVLKKHGYIFSIFGGMIVGGLFGALLIFGVLLFSPADHNAGLITAVTIWMFIGAIFGGLYSVGLKSILVFSEKKRTQADRVVS